MRAAPVLVILSLLSVPACSWGQVNAEVCDIARNPAQFNGELVRVRRQIQIAFEQFELAGADCKGQAISGIWLEYGRGPKRQPTTWCCGDMIPRDNIALIEDKDFRTFHRYLTAQRRKRDCYQGGCYANTVTATITGRIDAAKTRTCPDGKSSCCAAGFGHFGTYCVRLVIQKVTHVAAMPRN